ncbi:hypothetical protein [Kineosporia sp. R_H_3]|uniref:hypothetical protein n=1 Tax=Kineosporia sp. R_H_3 TaxID=1961848 RepID=UPI0013047270|nr:hypothetical protein [Kineosporia sp. R_H_3]
MTEVLRVRPLLPADALADRIAGSWVRDAALVAGGVGLLALSAQVAIPEPSPVW